MWIESVLIKAGYKGMQRLLLVALSVVMAAPGVAQDGQYRSKILLVPDGAWAKGTEISVEELERQLGSIEDAYAKSSAGRHLARHYVERKEYDKAIAYYKDALAATGAGRILRKYPLVGGIDLAGVVESSTDVRYRPGDAVLATGCGLSEAHDGGYADRKSVV